MEKDTRPTGGAHTQFKSALRSELLKRVDSTVRTRSGPSWDERVGKAMKGFQTQQKAVETEQLKTLSNSVERGRSRPTSSPVRSLAESPNQLAMLRQRQKDMKILEDDYKAHVESIKDKMQQREPLYRLSEVNAAFAMQRRRMQEKKAEMAQDERERWEHLRSVEMNAAKRPLLVEESGLRMPKKSASATAVSSGKEEQPLKPGLNAPTEIFGRDEYEKDTRIRNAVSQKWFLNSDWAAKVAEIKHRADTRQKLSEIPYPQKVDAHALSRARMQHNLCAQLRPVSAALLK